MLSYSRESFGVPEDLASLQVVLHRIVKHQDEVFDRVLQGLVFVPLS